MSGTVFLSLREGTSVSTEATGELTLESPQARVAFARLSPGILGALRQLTSASQDEQQLTNLVLQTDGPGALAKFAYYLHRLAHKGLLLRSVCTEGVRLATLVPMSSGCAFACQALSPDRRYALSRFAYLHRHQDQIVLESPLAHSQIVLHDGRAAALVHALARPEPVIPLIDSIPGLSAGAAELLLALLVNGGMVEALTDRGAMEENEDSALRPWEFHDLLFHTRSRQGRHDRPMGGTCRFAGELAPLPALKPPMAEEALELYRPDLERLQRDDPPFARVQETRRSVREYADWPITAGELGEFLYRVARVRERRDAEVATPERPVHMDFAPRPYPSGGTLYELELYLVASICEGLVPGLYHYDPLRHALEHLSGRTGDVGRLLEDASLASGIAVERVQILFVIAARFARVAWKYSAMAYALVLKNVGVLYQTMYLAATAMNLAPCGLGCGNADLFARAAGTNYYAETSVGEFLLGSKQQ